MNCSVLMLYRFNRNERFNYYTQITGITTIAGLEISTTSRVCRLFNKFSFSTWPGYGKG
jgi:hypothetical protein